MTSLPAAPFLWRTGVGAPGRVVWAWWSRHKACLESPLQRRQLRGLNAPHSTPTHLGLLRRQPWHPKLVTAGLCEYEQDLQRE